MSGSWSRASMERVMDQVQQRADAMRTYIGSQDIGTPLGQETVTDEEWLKAFDLMEAKFPPQLWKDEKTGLTFMGSAFTLALSMPNVDGGKAILDRARRLRGGA